MLVCDEEHATTAAVVDMLHKGRRSAGGVLGTIFETAMFARSHASPGIWAADLVAFGERRLALGYEDPPIVRRTFTALPRPVRVQALGSSASRCRSRMAVETQKAARRRLSLYEDAL